MRAWLLSIILGLGGLAEAAPPSAYRCTPGTSRPGVGCLCPRGFEARRDGENTAICHGRLPAPPKPATKSAPVKRSHAPLALAASAIRLDAKPLPPLAPTYRGTNDAYAAAWAAIAANRLPDGLEALERLATHQDPALRRAVLEDIARVYLELGTPEAAQKTLGTLATAPTILDALGRLYLAKPHAEGARAVYRDLARAYPAHPDRCRWLVAAARATAASVTSTPTDRMEAATAIATEWKRLAPQATSTSCRDDGAALIGELARWEHARGALDVAEPLYRLYASAFPELPAAPDHAYLLAELLWQRAEAHKTSTAWELAAIAFTEAARTGKLAPARTMEAASAALLAWKSALAKAPEVTTKRLDSRAVEGTSPRPLGARDRQLLASLELYIATVPSATDDELPGVKLLRANTLRSYDHLDEAITQYRDILEHHPGAEVAEYAANLALESLGRLGRFAELLALTDKLLADAGFLAGKDRLAETLVKLKRAGLQRRAAKLAAEGPAKAVECGRTFVDAYNADPLASDADVSLFNAMVCFEQGAAWASELRVFAVLEHHHAGSRLFAKAKEMAATARPKLRE